MQRKIMLLGSGELGKEFVIADIIVPEIEAIRTERFYAYERQGIDVGPSAKAANFTMNRRAIRDLAANRRRGPIAAWVWCSLMAMLVLM